MSGALEEARRRRAAFVQLPPTTDPVRVALDFDRIREPLDEPGERADLTAATHPDAAARERAEDLQRRLAEFDTELGLDRGLFERLGAVDVDAVADPDARRVIERALRDFRRAGVDRDEATRERVRALERELVEVGQRFDRHVRESVGSVRVEGGHGELEGMPADFLEARPEEADGSVTLTTDPPDSIPILMYAESDRVRRRMSAALQRRAVPENLPVLKEMLVKRHEMATLLGYPSWAAYVTEDKMAVSPERVRAFLDDVIARARPRLEQEHADLLAEKRKVEPDADTVYDWERGWLIERIKRSRFGFDSREMRPYLAYESVERGVLDTVARLFGVEFRREDGPDRWHEDVRSFGVYEGGELVGRFHLDMFPREDKFKHAAQFGVRHGLEGERLPEGALVCNLARPTADDPGLLLHRDVVTLFHEFGHLMHHLLGGRVRFLRHSGVRTEWDFVEVPSQLLEEWAWDPDVLASFATHVETGEPIPAELVRGLRAAEEYGKGIGVTVQMLYARISLDLHAGDPGGLDPAQVVRDLRRELSPFPGLEDAPAEPGESTEGLHMEASFGHLHGYSALYYSYMWALGIAKDLWSAFGGADDLEAARRYRETVLAPGGGRDAAELVRGFLGRDFDLAAWDAWLRN